MKKHLPYFLMLAIFFFLLGKPVHAQLSGEALFIVADATAPNAAETALDSVLTELELTVTIVGQDEANDDAMTGKSLILISATVSSGTIATNVPGLPTVAIPVINWEPFLYDFLGYSELDGGEYNTTEIEIVGEGHQMAAGLANGVVTISTVEKAVSYGAPAGNIELIAVNAADAGQAVLFGYDEGAEMFTGTAPARRVGTFLLNDVADSSMTEDGWELFKQSVKWAMNYVDPSGIEVDLNDNALALRKIFPNPFGGTTNIEFSVPVQSNIRLIVCDALGRTISVLVDGIWPAGNHSITFDATELSSGVYFCKLVSRSHTISKQLLLLK